MFRLQNNVPEIYVDRSRDFQLLCRLADISFDGTKHLIDSILYTSSTSEMSGSLLRLLKSKIGYFKSDTLTDDQLRYLLSAFPSIIKDKGSETGIKKAVYTWLRMFQLYGKLSQVNINNDNYAVYISIDSPPTDTSILENILEYIVPAGYVVMFEFASETGLHSNYNYNSNITQGYTSSSLSIVKTKPSQDQTTITDRLSNTVGLTFVKAKPTTQEGAGNEQ